MSAIFDFAAEYDLSAALTELRVAIRLRDGRGRNEDCSPRPTQINIVSIAAMHTPLPQWVIFVRSTRFRRSRHVRFAPIASEPSHRSESTRCANSGREQMQQDAQQNCVYSTT
jgi:hypothetical protein